MPAVVGAILLCALTAQSHGRRNPREALLPESIRASLDTRFPGWRLAETVPGVQEEIDRRSPGSLPNLVTGDFDGNGRGDYAVMIEHTNFDARGKAFTHVTQTLVFLAGPGTLAFRIIELIGQSPAPTNWYLTLRKKGAEGFDFEANRRFRYPQDSIAYTHYDKAASGTYIYTKGAFRYVTEAD